jgi:hypothetical protein
MGLDYIGEVEIESGKSIHSEQYRLADMTTAESTVRCHKASATAAPRFHSIDTRPGSEGGAIFKTGGDLHWFDY